MDLPRLEFAIDTDAHHDEEDEVDGGVNEDWA